MSTFIGKGVVLCCLIQDLHEDWRAQWSVAQPLGDKPDRDVGHGAAGAGPPSPSQGPQLERVHRVHRVVHHFWSLPALLGPGRPLGFEIPLGVEVLLSWNPDGQTSQSHPALQGEPG